jgi:hypothetical protein
MHRVLLAKVSPDWLRKQVQPDWLERYGPRASEFRFPSEEDERKPLLHQVGQDGWGLLEAFTTDPQSQWMLLLPAVDTDASNLETKLFAEREGRDEGLADEDRLEASRLFFSPYESVSLGSCDLLNLLDR